MILLLNQIFVRILFNIGSKLKAMNYYIILLVTIQVLVAIFPLLGHKNTTGLGNSVLEDEWDNDELLISLLFGIFSPATFVIDIFYDYLNPSFYLCKGYYPRNLLLIFFLVPNIFLYFTLGKQDNMVIIVFIILVVQSMLILWSILMYLCEFSDFIKLDLQDFLIFISFSSMILLTVYEVAYNQMTTTLLFGASIFLYIIANYILYKKVMIWYNKNLKEKPRIKFTVDEWCCICCLFWLLTLTTSWMLLKIFLYRHVSTLVNRDCIVFIINVTAFSCLCMLLQQYRTAKSQAVQFKHAFEAKKAFCRTTAHEIRTPLNTVFLGFQLIEKEMKETGIFSKDLLEMFDDVLKSCNVAIDLVSDLLTHDKLTDGMLVLEKFPIKFWPFVKETISPFMVQAKESGIKIQFEEDFIDQDIKNCFVDGDKHKLSQVFRNLISNALKFTPRRGYIKIKVEKISDPNNNNNNDNNNKNNNKLLNRSQFHPASLWRTFTHHNNSIGSAPASEVVIEIKNWIRVQVIDSGAGISKENQVKLFKSEVQFNPGLLQNGKGSGLGMMITKGIVDLHGGYISVYSAGEGSGCTFTLDLLLSDYSSASAKQSVKSYHSLTPMKRRSLAAIMRSTSIDIRREDTNNSITSNPVKPFQSTDSKDYLPTELGGRCFGTHMKYSEDFVNGEISRDFCIKESLESSEKPLGLRFLVVDDAQLNRKMICRLLKGRCELTVEAEDGVEAIKEYEKSVLDGCFFDVVLMDYNMPNMDGPDAARGMRERGFTGIIIGVSGNVLPNEITHYLSSGADQVLSKPVDFKKLEAALADFNINISPDNEERKSNEAAATQKVKTGMTFKTY